MQNFFKVSLLMIFLIASIFSSSFAQTIWTKDLLNNPVLGPGQSGSWDDDGLGPASILFDGNTYHMWYSGYDGTTYRIGYATSPDEINWTKYDDPSTTNPPFAESDPVLNLGTTGSWDNMWVIKPYVLFDGDTTHMWYTGFNGSIARIGYATSLDGITWTKYDDPTTTNPPFAESDPVLNQGPPGSWDVGGVESPCILFDGSIYHMWYDGWWGPNNFHIGYATSPDRITWTKYDDSTTTNPPFAASDPVLNPGPPGSWDYPRVDSPDVLFDGTNYHMWYSGGATLWSWRIGYSTSPNGINWTKYDDPTTTNPPFTESDPVLNLGSTGSWDDQFVGSSRVILDTTSSMYKMWYLGGDADWDASMGFATAPLTMPDTIHVPGIFPTIQAAIDAASDGNVVLVADGTYLENINFKGKAITVASHFYVDSDTSHISNTIIDGSSPSNPDSGSVVSFLSGEDTNSVLCGFTIMGGTGISSSSWRLGGGIFCSGVAGAKIIDNHIIENKISGENAAGAGIEFYANPGILILEGNHFKNNRVIATPGWGSGGAVDAWGDGINVRIVNNVFENDTLISDYFAGGGAVFLEGGSSLVGGKIYNNKFRNNYAKSTNGNGLAGGLYIAASSDMEIKDNLFKNNSAISQFGYAEGGGLIIDDNGVSDYGRKMVVGNTFIDNVANSLSGGGGRGGAIELFYTTATLNGNYFKQNSAQGGGAVWGGAIRIAASAFLLENNIFTGNNANSGGAVIINSPPHSGSEMEFINNTFVNNTASSTGGGILVSNVPVPVNVFNSIIWGNSPDQISGSFVAQYNDIQGGWPGTGNINVDPMFVSGDSLYNLSDSSLCIGAGIDSIQISSTWYHAPLFDFDGDPRPMPAGSMPDMGAQENSFGTPLQGNRRLVPQQYSTIQSAINVSVNGDTVLVSDGAYVENINFKGKAITVASHFYFDGDTSHISNTIIDGSDPSHSDSGSVVYFVSGEDTNSVLSGFTITGGTGTIDSPNNWRNGGGIYATDSSPHLKNNIIESNIITYNNDSYGGGIYVLHLNNNFIIENNMIRNNELISSSVTDYSLGAGIYVAAGGTETIRILGNRIINNAISAPVGYGCGITPANVGNANYLIFNNIVSGNIINAPSGASGGIDIYEHFPMVHNNLFTNNTAPTGAGIGIEFTSAKTNESGARGSKPRSKEHRLDYKTSNVEIVKFSNNTVVNNSATVSGGGIGVIGGTIPQLINLIVWGNTAPSNPQISGTADVQYSDVEGGYSGTGNINSDPFFADSVFNLADSSLCIGAGIDSIEISGTWYYAPPFDYDGDPRPNPVDNFVDMGAQESPFPKIIDIIKKDLDNLPKIFSLKQNYPNPFNPRTTIEFSIPETETVTLKIYNLLGQEVATLVSDKFTPGVYKYDWDASDFASGVYMYKIDAGSFTQTRKLILMK